jgi:hypothetical protein
MRRRADDVRAHRRYAGDQPPPSSRPIPSRQSRNASKTTLGVHANNMPKNTACKVVMSFRSLDVTFASQDKRFGPPSVALGSPLRTTQHDYFCISQRTKCVCQSRPRIRQQKMEGPPLAPRKARPVCWIVRKQDHRALTYLYSLSGSLHISSLIRNSPCSKDSSEKASSRLVNKRKIMLPQTRVRPATISATPRAVIFTSLKTRFRLFCKANWSGKMAAARLPSGSLFVLKQKHLAQPCHERRAPMRCQSRG